jgi:bacillaene synthase trans-acting acyltransferase
LAANLSLWNEWKSLKIDRLKTIFMFSGQGAQYYHMGAQLYASNKVFRGEMDAIDKMIRDRVGFSIIDLIYAPQRSKTEALDDTVLSNLAIFMVERALTTVLAHHGCRPDMVLGVSMGALAAACAAGAIGFPDILEAAIKQAKAFEADCSPGAMLALLAPPALYQENLELSKTSEVAAVNSPFHFVISFPSSEAASIAAFLLARKVPFQSLPVSRAYHSRWIDPARRGFFAAFKDILYQRSRVPLSFCTSAPPTYLLTTEAIWDAIRKSIGFIQTIQQLEREGSNRYIDVGTSGTLATLLKHGISSKSGSRVEAILTPIGDEHRNLQKVLFAVGRAK